MDHASIVNYGYDIRAYKNFLDPAICQVLINKFEADERKQESPQSEGYYNNRKSIELRISPLPEWNDWDQIIFKKIGSTLNEYYSSYRVGIEYEDEGYTICKYNIGDGVNFHWDGGCLTRLTTAVIQLNSPQEGGKLIFPLKNLEIKPEQGTLLLFPPTYTHAHYVEATEDIPRYIISTWIHIKPDGQRALREVTLPGL